ncbi:carbamoyl-phosphate synthase large subunit [Dehalococcoidia bacterium]|nr:carbamoyl-phosphate synthase large subunit [Dehalococcoidia bacterium]
MNRISKVLVIGSGPIIIGQAAEFDYAGTQACKALKEEGVTTVLVNSNPATIMTDTGIADIIYIEPLTVDVLTRIIEIERPDGVLPTLGGQTGLNLAVDLNDAGVLDKYNVKLLGTPLETIRKAEDRDLFRDLLIEIGEPVPTSSVAETMDQVEDVARDIGLPIVIRPAYTLGGTGGGIANTWNELIEIAKGGLSASPISQVLLERSLVGWKEIEYEVIRDGSDNCITICNMENMDPMGVHTGDSIVVAPSQTLTDKEYQMLRSASLKIIRALGIEGGCNVQYALSPNKLIEETLPSGYQHSSQYYVIEVNPRVSRSSALASKATGYPIARVAAKIAVGKTLDKIHNAVTGNTTAAFEPALDYCVVKIPRWPFDKFATGDRNIGTQMKATGEVMAIERSFESAFQKAVRSLEIGGYNMLWEDPDWTTDPEAVLDSLPLFPTDLRLWALMASLRRNIGVEDIAKHTGIDPWFIHRFKNIVDMENKLRQTDLTADILRAAKKMGFSDQQIGHLKTTDSDDIRMKRKQWGIIPSYKMVDTCAAEFEAVTPYFYSTYELENEAESLTDNKSVVIGSGPIRIGQGIEFDYCSVHAAWALQEAGIKSIMANSNPETVSTDFDTSDRLYFEPLDEESLKDIIDNETVNYDDGPDIPASMVQFGGQTAINLSQELDESSMPILGSTADTIDIASDRARFEDFLTQLDIPRPPGHGVNSLEEAMTVAEDIGYPVLVRPSYVLGGRAMEIVQNQTELIRYVSAASQLGTNHPVLIDKYLVGREVELDAICDGENVLIPGIMEHIERAGVHSGDSMGIYPGVTLTEQEVEVLVEYTTKIGLALKVKGLMNIQYVIVGGDPYRSPEESKTENTNSSIYVLEVNPRSSRTVPFLSKVTGVPIVNIATKIMLGNSLISQGYSGGLSKRQNLVAVKAPVFSMSKLAGVDTYLGPEMKSTGEVMGIDDNFRGALAKALIASGLVFNPGDSILLSIADQDKVDALQLLKSLNDAECKLYATEGTAAMIEGLGMPVTMITKKLGEGHPNAVDVINDGIVKAVINTITGERSHLQDGFEIRRSAAEKRIPCFTSIDTARAAVESLLSGTTVYSVKSIDKYLKNVST